MNPIHQRVRCYFVVAWLLFTLNIALKLHLKGIFLVATLLGSPATVLFWAQLLRLEARDWPVLLVPVLLGFGLDLIGYPFGPGAGFSYQLLPGLVILITGS